MSKIRCCNVIVLGQMVFGAVPGAIPGIVGSPREGFSSAPNSKSTFSRIAPDMSMDQWA